jgi:hypothetical protein
MLEINLFPFHFLYIKLFSSQKHNLEISLIIKNNKNKNSYKLNLEAIHGSLEQRRHSRALLSFAAQMQIPYSPLYSPSSSAYFPCLRYI